MHDKKDYSQCKKWLQETHPVLYEKLYAAEDEKKAAEGGEEEKK